MIENVAKRSTCRIVSQLLLLWRLELTLVAILMSVSCLVFLRSSRISSHCLNLALENKQSELRNAVTDLSADEKQMYMQLVGVLQNIAGVTRPDISFASAFLARYMSNPCALDAEWCRLLLCDDLRLEFAGVQLDCDNSAATRLARDTIASDRTKHVEISHRKIQELLEEEKMKADCVSTKLQIADVFTKPLNNPQFIELRSKLGVVDLEK